MTIEWLNLNFNSPLIRLNDQFEPNTVCGVIGQIVIEAAIHIGPALIDDWKALADWRLKQHANLQDSQAIAQLAHTNLTR